MDKTENEVAAYVDYRQSLLRWLTFGAGIRADHHIRLSTDILLELYDLPCMLGIKPVKHMEVISIEKKTFEEITVKFDEFVKWIENVCRRNNDKGMGEWLDNQEVCKLLNICPRTLQTLRDNGTLAYNQIHHKIYYRTGAVLF